MYCLHKNPPSPPPPSPVSPASSTTPCGMGPLLFRTVLFCDAASFFFFSPPPCDEPDMLLGDAKSTIEALLADVKAHYVHK